MHLPSTLLPFLLAVGWLQAQAPLLSDGAEALRREELVWALAPSERPVSPTSPAEDHLRLTEAGAFGIDSSMPTLRVPLSEGLGLGTAQLGSGLMFHGSAKWGRLEAEATLLALRDPQGRALGRLHSGAISFITPGGWRLALEQTPLKWGYGPSGGHLFGTSAETFPRLGLQSRTFNPRVGEVSFGQWRFETFLGRVEGQRQVPVWQAGYAYDLAEVKARGGDLERPFLSGYRLVAEFGERVEFQFGWANMWGGTNPDGTNTMRGLSLGDYFLTALGSGNILKAEASGDPNHPSGTLNGTGPSNALAAAEIRFRLPELATWLEARGAYVYYARSGENLNWQWKDFFRNPLEAGWKDTKFIAQHFGKKVWVNDRWASVPSLMPPTQGLGFQILWPHWALGGEYRFTAPDDTNIATYYQTYEHGQFVSGHSRYGDALGLMFGGNLYTRVLTADWNPGDRASFRLMLTSATRAFRDEPNAWAAAHPGLWPPLNNTFFHAETSARFRLGNQVEAGLSYAFMKERHLHFADETQTGHNLLMSVSRKF